MKQNAVNAVGWVLLLSVACFLCSTLVFAQADDIEIADSSMGTDSVKSPAAISVCTADAKICADGSTRGRSGPTCTFAPCPEEIDPDAQPSGEERTYGTLEAPEHNADDLDAHTEPLLYGDDNDDVVHHTKENIFARIWHFITSWF